MNKKVWTNLMVAMLVLGLFMTVSCAKKTVVSDGTAIEDQARLEAEAAAAAERERIKAEEMARERALAEAKTAAARAQFENQNIHFDFDSAELSPMAKTLLKEKAEWLSANPGVSVVIEGHCDDRGTTEYNIALGEKRALAAKNYLVDLGVSEARLSTVSFGEERPLDSASTEEAYSKNRRAQFVL
ncbi:MAG: peptidoglycan-associated lipoprotein Pal [Proteobacteria bacterium]|nr:peptidoglycan-associated lipoprotein Pal [Desulfobacula sp.]MBU3950514.1 peptidoglycan-associated lipoprotein Pal [Pseudomonadota bacterium]MBU4131679.1 peptidoglycan-associated lipoprotein Pal [Pseudomonadota bacterium]